MSQTIILTDLVITQVLINYELSNVDVHFNKVDANGKVWDRGIATFWAVLPTEPNPYWFQLSPEYITLLLGMKNDADAALTAAFLI